MTDETFMKERPVLPLLVSMALPMMISMLVNSLYNIVDSFFVARISEDAMTALALIYPVQNFINAVAIGFGIGINAVIAYYLGAGSRQKANIAATHGLILSVFHGVILMLGCMAGIPVFLNMFTTDTQVIDLGIRYCRIAFACAPIIALDIFYEKIFQAIGNMKVPMTSLMCGCAANIVLDPILIFGLGPFPKMGIEGAALATCAGQLITLVIYLAACRLSAISVQVGRQYLIRDVQMDLRLYSIGIPAILNLALPSLLISSLNAILAAYSQIYVVILGIYYKLQTFLYLPANGIIQGMRPLIGYNYGAGEDRRVRDIYKTTLCMSGAIMVLGTVICLTVPGNLLRLFTSNEETILAGQTALRIISAGFIVSSVSVTSSGALEGLGKGTPSLIISLVRYTIVIIPAAFILSRLAGAVGVWHAFWISEAAAAIIAFFVYQKAVRHG